MKTEDKVAQLDKLLVQVTASSSIGSKDIAKLVEICETYDVNPTTLYGALFSYYVMVFDKETFVAMAKDRTKVLIGSAKAFASMSIGLIAGMNMPYGVAITDVLLTAVERNEVESDCVTVVLGSKGDLNHYISVVKRAVNNMRAVLGDEGY